MRSDCRARVFGCPHGAEGVEVARGAPGEIGCPGAAGAVALPVGPSRIGGESAAGSKSRRCRVRRWWALVRSEDRARVLGRPGGGEGAAVARCAPGEDRTASRLPVTVRRWRF